MSARKRNLKLIRKEVRNKLQEEGVKVAKTMFIQNRKLRKNIKIILLILLIENLGFAAWIIISLNK